MLSVDLQQRPGMGSYQLGCRCTSRIFSSTSFPSVGAVLFPPFSLPFRKLTTVSTSASSTLNPSSSHFQSSPEFETVMTPGIPRWKPTCLYYTHGLCTKMNEPIHLEKFNHDLSPELQVNANEVTNLQSQHLDYLLVLDLEGKVEILEFPVVMIDAKTMNYVDFFHRPVRDAKFKFFKWPLFKVMSMGLSNKKGSVAQIIGKSEISNSGLGDVGRLSLID